MATTESVTPFIESPVFTIIGVIAAAVVVVIVGCCVLYVTFLVCLFLMFGCVYMMQAVHDLVSSRDRGSKDRRTANSDVEIISIRVPSDHLATEQPKRNTESTKL